MGETTKVQWADSTINCWMGCAKVDATCKQCYAEVQTPVRVKRARGLELWGVRGARTETKDWERNLRRWNEAARKDGVPRRVFAQSLADTFEAYGGGQVHRADGRIETTLIDLRTRFLTVVGECDSLIFEMLTKHPRHVMQMVPLAWRKKWPEHVQIGTSAGTQKGVDERVPHLLRIPAKVRFLSAEPLLERIDVRRYLGRGTCVACPRDRSVPRGVPLPWLCEERDRYDHKVEECGLQWVICGGEYHRDASKARPFDIAWMRDLRDQCKAADVAFFAKQMGAHVRSDGIAGPRVGGGYDEPWPADTRLSGSDHGIDGKGWRAHLRDVHGGDETEWPHDLRGLRAFPTHHVAQPQQKLPEAS